MSQTVPKPTGAVIRSSPDGFVVVSESSVSAVCSLFDDVATRAVQQLALLGQHEAARVAMEQRHFEIGFQRRNLTAHRRLAHVQRSPACVKLPASAAA